MSLRSPHHISVYFFCTQLDSGIFGADKFCIKTSIYRVGSDDYLRLQFSDVRSQGWMIRTVPSWSTAWIMLTSS